MSEHTPGPWMVYADGIEAGPEGGFRPFGGCGCCGSPWMNGADSETAKADARLIAAAPDLLEALDELESWLVCACIASPEDMAQSFPHMLQVVQAAIAKAEGV